MWKSLRGIFLKHIESTMTWHHSITLSLWCLLLQTRQQPGKVFVASGRQGCVHPSKCRKPKSPTFCLQAERCLSMLKTFKVSQITTSKIDQTCASPKSLQNMVKLSENSAGHVKDIWAIAWQGRFSQTSFQGVYWQPHGRCPDPKGSFGRWKTCEDSI